MAKQPTLVSAAAGALTPPAAAAAPLPAAAPPPPVAPAVDDQASRADLVQARVLVAFDGYEPNDVVEVTAAEAKRHELDADPAAVAYALSLVEA